jgi:hypothetical protein
MDYVLTFNKGWDTELIGAVVFGHRCRQHDVMCPALFKRIIELVSK